MPSRTTGTGTRCYLEKRKDSPNYYICEYVSGDRKWRRTSTGTGDHGEAQKILAQHILRLEKRLVVNDATVLHVMLRYWSLRAKHHFSRATAKCMLAKITEHEPSTLIYDWPDDKQREFIAKISDNKATQRRYWGILRSAVKWMHEDQKELPSLPALVRIKDKEANSKGKGTKPWSVDELRKLFGAAQLEHEQLLLLMCLVTDARPGAVLELTWDRIDLAHGFADLNVPGRPITNKRRGVAPLSSTVLAYLAARRSLGPVVQWKGRRLKTFKMTFLRLTKRAQITGTAYRVRKGVATYLRSQKISVADVKAMLSHNIGGQTDEYAHYDPAYMSEVKQAMERLLAMLAPPWLAPYLPSQATPAAAANEELFSGARAANDGVF